jgi:YbbR domain-containing protein
MEHFINKLLNNRFTRKIDRRIFVYLGFVAISAVFWLLNELSGNYNTYINYPVKFTNLPQNKVLVNDLPEKLNLNVTAYGYTLLRYKLSPANYPIIINMEEFGNNFGNLSSKQFKLQTRFIRETISRQLPSDIEVLDILPDTIPFQFATIASKKVPIKPNVKLNFDEQCMLNGEIVFNPDSILIKGPNTMLDTLKAVYTKYKEFNGLSSPIEQVINLQAINKIEFDIKKTNILLPVSKFTQANFEVPILTKNVPDSLELKTFPRMAKITCQIALNDYDKVQPKDFIVVVDYSDVANLLGNKLSLKLDLVPAKAKLVTFFPESVEFILDKKQ